MQLRIFSSTDTVEINFPAALVEQSSALLPENVKITLDSEAIDLVQRMNEPDKTRKIFLEVTDDSDRVEMGYVPVARVRIPARHAPRDFRIVAENFSLTASLPILHMFVTTLAGSSDEKMEFFKELGRAIKKPGRYSIVRVRSGGEKLQIFLE